MHKYKANVGNVTLSLSLKLCCPCQSAVTDSWQQNLQTSKCLQSTKCAKNQQNALNSTDVSLLSYCHPHLSSGGNNTITMFQYKFSAFRLFPTHTVHIQCILFPTHTVHIQTLLLHPIRKQRNLVKCFVVHYCSVVTAHNVLCVQAMSSSETLLRVYQTTLRHISHVRKADARYLSG